jgi:hypothetical protein
MPDYVFTNRDGEVYDVSSPEELTEDQIKKIDLELNPARASDYFSGAASAVSDFGYNVLETAHEVGNFIGGKISESLYGTKGSDVENPWSEFKKTSRDVYEGDIPDHVKNRLSYKVTKGIAQLPPMIASGVLAPVTLASQGFASGRDDYLSTLNIDTNTATQDELESARAVGSMVAIPTVVLEKIGLGKLASSLTKPLIKAGVSPALKSIATTAAIEGVTEGAEQLASNVIAKDLAQYDPNRKRSEGVGESALIGSIVAGVPTTVKVTPDLAYGAIKDTSNAIKRSAEIGTTLSKSKAAKKLVDMSANGLISTKEMSSDIGNRMAGALIEKGINVEPLVKGGEFVAEKMGKATGKAVGISKDLKNIVPKAVEAFQQTGTYNFIDDVIRPINDRVSSINKRIGGVLMSFEHEHQKRYHDFYKKAEPALDAMSSMKKASKADFNEFHKSILKKDWKQAESLFAKYGDTESWQSIPTLLRGIYEESAKRGSGVGHIEEYFPRFVKDYSKLSEKLGSPIPKTQWGRMVKEAEDNKGEDLTSEEIGALFEDAVRSKRKEGVEKGSPAFTKQRKLDEVDDDIADQYADPLEAMVMYMNQMSDQITRLDYVGAMYDIVEAKETGKDPIYKPEEVPQGDKPKLVKKRKLGKFGEVIAQEQQAGNLTEDQYDKVMRILGARFQKKAPMKDFVRGAKTMTHLAFLGSPTTAITQLGDYAYSIYKNGINETLKAVGKPKFRLEDIYQIENQVSFEFNDSGKVPDGLKKTLDKVLTLTGMRAMDSKAKATFLTSTFNRWQKEMKGESKKKYEIIKKIQDVQGIEQADKTVQDIQAGRKTEGVTEMLLYEISDIAPISQSDMPLMYNKYPDLRILYALKSYTLKQFNFARKEAFAKMMSGDKNQVKEGFSNMLRLLTALGLANAPAEALKALITGDELRLSDVTTENLWRLLGLNSYTSVIAKREGIGSAFEALSYKPPMIQFIDDVGHDVLNFTPPLLSEDSKSLKYVPVIGKLLYKWRKNYGDED